ncbi:GtrA family protein [Undibacterium sp. TJN19]|uniref:GtrA family protein n=1 Tax=Undibacterium sp. TJN19 TaxID=3413055 RepID=UPI003BEFEE52
MQLTIMYAMFALIATAVNIGTQDIVTRHYNGMFFMFVSLAVGTAAGLIVKYILDKRYIFQYQTENTVQDSKMFALYSLMGLATTTVFWGFEFCFDFFFHTREMRYVGGIIGLAIGYLCKYKLDKRYVFHADPA